MKEILENHLVLMVLYAAGTAAFFALLWKDDPRERMKFFAIVFLVLIAGGILIATLLQAI